MSWCRWSTICPNNNTSDLYIYDDCAGGVTIVVARRKRINEHLAPKVPDWGEVDSFDKNDKESRDRWVQNYVLLSNKRVNWLKENAEYKDIGLAYDGKIFNVVDKEELLSTLTMLREAGYNFPDYIFEYAENYEEAKNNE